MLAHWYGQGSLPSAYATQLSAVPPSVMIRSTADNAERAKAFEIGRAHV